MTISIQTVGAPDVSTDNDVINLGASMPLQSNMLAGVHWSVVGLSHYDSLVLVLKHIFGLLGSKLPGYSTWLLVGNFAWQPDTRLVRYRKLWGSLEARGVKLSDVAPLQEVMVEAGGKLKFFGAARLLSALSIESVVNAFLEERCTYVAAFPSDHIPVELLKLGWSGDLRNDPNLVAYLTNTSVLLFERLGEFDDLERGFIGVGQCKLVNELLT